MAKPPEPIEEVLPNAAWVVDAEVVEVLKTGSAPPRPKAPSHASDIGQKSATQQVKLKINSVLKGEPVKELIVNKPEAGYMLKAGNHGPFLVDETHTILGRYGPDSYSFDRLKAALKK